MPFFSKKKIVVDSSTTDNYTNTTEIIQLQKHFYRTYSIPLEISVAHYTPSIFPLIPVINDPSPTNLP